MNQKELDGAIASFLMENPQPTDQQFHAFAMSLNVDKETLEAHAYAMLSAFLRGEIDVVRADDYDGEEEEEDEPDVSVTASAKRRLAQSQKKTAKKKTTSADFGTNADLEDVQNRQVYVAEMMQRIATQHFIDDTVYLLRLDGFSQEATNLSEAYAGLRSAMLTNAESVIADPIAEKVRKAIAQSNNRVNGEAFRIAYCRMATNGMRELASRYGDGAKGQFFLSAK